MHHFIAFILVLSYAATGCEGKTRPTAPVAPEPVAGVSTSATGSVRVLYVVPNDKEFQRGFSEGISKAIVDVQGWYRNQLGGATFDIYSVVPEQCRLPRKEAYYAGADGWQKVLDDIRHCAPVEHGSTEFTWVLYLDVVEKCDGYLDFGRGGDGVVMLANKDLRGVAGLSSRPDCNRAPTLNYIGRWYGGLAHEIAHALHVPHPPGCDEGLDTCDNDALMWRGYADYPGTYFRDDEKEILARSPFIHD